MGGGVTGGEEDTIVIGQIVRAHGIKGEVKVAPVIPWPEGFRVVGAVYLECRDRKGWFDILRGRWEKGGAVLSFREIPDRNAAETFRSCLVRVRREDMPLLSTGDHYDHELIGLKVMTRSGEPVGMIKNILHLPGQDVYEIQSSDGTVRIPAVDAFIKKIDLESGVMTIEPIEGLLDADAD